MTEKQHIQILMVDDHPLILEAYKEVLSLLEPERFSFHIEVSNHCDLAWEKIISNKYDMLFLDMSFPKQKNSKFISGEDLGGKVREKYPTLKIIILTQIEDSFHLNSIIDAIKPDGLLLKRETNPVLLTNCVLSVMDATPFYSPRIIKLMQSKIEGDFLISKYDRIMLHQLSLGTKTKNLNQYIPLSLRAIENRKRRLKDIFCADNDKTLLANAREQGYV